MRSKANTQNKFMRFITVPIRALYKARDCYVGSMNNFAERGRYGNISGPAAMPRSFSVTSSTASNDSSSEDQRELRELIRALSRSTSVGSANHTGVGMDLYVQQQMRKSTAAAAMGSRRVPRSCSVGMGKIEEEDEPCDSGEDSVRGKAELVYPRSMSYAVTKTSVVF